MNYLRGLGGGTGARLIVQLTDNYSVLDGASVHSDNNLLAGTPRGRYEGGRSLQGGEQGQHQRRYKGGRSLQGGEQGQHQRGGGGDTQHPRGTRSRGNPRRDQRRRL